MKLIHSLALIAALGLGGQAEAKVVSGALTGGTAVTSPTPPPGSFVLLHPGPGFTVGNNDQQTNNLYAFNEKQGVTLTSAITTAMGTIAAGTKVNSQYVFFDPAPSRTAVGNVKFDGNILAIFADVASEKATDALFGLPFVNYESPKRRGLEKQDSFTVAPPDQINVKWSASTPGDYVRVITAVSAAPEPAVWSLIIGGFGMMGFVLRRKNQQQPALAYS